MEIERIDGKGKGGGNEKKLNSNVTEWWLLQK